MGKILVTGSLAYDYIMNFNDSFKNHILPEKIHVLSVSFVTEKLKKQFGGTGGNIAYNLSLLGIESVLFSTAGKDFDEYKTWLEEKGVSTNYIQVFNDDFTASAHIITDQDDNQITGFHTGAMTKNNISIQHILDSEDIDYAIIAPNGKEGNMRYIKELIARNIPYILDPGQNVQLFEPEELRFAIDSAEMLVVNDYELSLVEKITGYSKKYLQENLKYFIITLGSKGSAVFHNGKEYTILPVPAAISKDPTGAGDAYRAGLILGLIGSHDPQTMGELGSTSAVYAVEKYGTQVHSYTKEEFIDRYNKTFNKTLTF